ncbi:TPA: hypothetical protein RQB50_001830 [Clostridioides difficile]|nr:phage/plasmid primase, P4 family [Clostridioides difficile]EJA6344997.1 hypothetical protein [Clostridioides difficile]EJA6641328.1 hypothetical protein [Clostridioides difficile]EJA6778137.1 hypothetical protein [Clostridioides difficile]EKJ1810055.1 hypothetical protein [Clostridioides difficile]EQK35596.1 phage/plasmid primase, P4 family, C-terminal domain protein [Clostridioides difficile P75]
MSKLTKEFSKQLKDAKKTLLGIDESKHTNFWGDEKSKILEEKELYKEVHEFEERKRRGELTKEEQNEEQRLIAFINEDDEQIIKSIEDYEERKRHGELTESEIEEENMNIEKLRAIDEEEYEDRNSFFDARKTNEFKVDNLNNLKNPIRRVKPNNTFCKEIKNSLNEVIHSNIKIDAIPESKIFTFDNIQKENLKEEDENRNLDEKYSNKILTQLTEEFLDMKQFFSIQNSLYTWNKEYSFYQLVNVEDELLEIKRYIQPIEKRAKIHPSILKALIINLKSEPLLNIKQEKLNAYNMLVNFRNGILDLITMKFQSHDCENDKKFYFNYCLDCDFKTEIYNIRLNTWNNFVKTSLLGDKNKEILLFQIIGYILSDIKGASKSIFIFLGESDSGKSVCLNFIQYIMCSISGAHLVSNLKLDQLGERFLTAELSRSKININGEIASGLIKNMSDIKNCSGNDYITAEFKNKNPFNFKCNSKLLYGANQLPKVKGEMTNAFVNRLKILHFPVSVAKENQDVDLGDKFICEASDIVSMSMYHLNKLILDKYCFMKDEGGEIIKKNYIPNINPIGAFIEDCCIFDSLSKVYSSDLYDAYMKYCKLNNIDYQTETAFTRKINQNYPNIENKKIRINGGASLRGFVGIDLKQKY